MPIDRLKNATALRTYATREKLAEAVGALVARALSEDLQTHHISITGGKRLVVSGEYHLVLWADR